MVFCRPMIDYWITSVGFVRQKRLEKVSEFFQITKLDFKVIWYIERLNNVRRNDWTSIMWTWRCFRWFSLRPTFWSFFQFFCMLSLFRQPISFLFFFSMVTFSKVHRSKRLKINFQIELHKEVSLWERWRGSFVRWVEKKSHHNYGSRKRSSWES